LHSGATCLRASLSIEALLSGREVIAGASTEQAEQAERVFTMRLQVLSTEFYQAMRACASVHLSGVGERANKTRSVLQHEACNVEHVAAYTIQHRACRCAASSLWATIVYNMQHPFRCAT
jgi:hypothetical protein